jgi:hypothetical protein
LLDRDKLGLNIAVHIRRLEREACGFPAAVEWLPRMYGRHGIPEDLLG